ncbi:hypothetical protein R6Q59_021740 [Mikania micrantha]
MSFKLKSIKKLIHAQKVCRSFTKIFQSKLHTIKVCKVIKKVTSFLISSRLRSQFRPIRQRSTTSHHYHIFQEGSPVIFIRQLYVQKSGQRAQEQTTSKDNEPDVGFTSTSTSSSSNFKKKVTVKHDSLLHEKKKDEKKCKKRDRLHTRDVRGVDERAEDFISKVREDMKLQREQSILEFHEMLARSV